MNKIQKKISKEVKRRDDAIWNEFYSKTEKTQLENGTTLYKYNKDLLEWVFDASNRYRIKKQVIKEFKEQGIL